MPCVPRRNQLRERTNIEMSFLILLMEEDYVKLPRYCFKSNKDRISMSRGKFPGTLYIRHYADMNLIDLKKEFIIDGHPLPKQLYVRLPKENIYVPYENYSTKYLNSKLAELRDLFIHLKAKKIVITKTEIVGKKIGGSANMGVSNIGGIGAGLENETTMQNEFKEELYIDADNNPIDTSFFSHAARRDSYFTDANNYVKPKFFYLPQEYEWEDIIERRLNNKLVQDRYTYYHSDTRLLKANLTSQLKFFDINIDMEKSEQRQLKIEYDIEYHPLVVPASPQKSIVQEKEEQEQTEHHNSIFQFPKLEIGKKHERKVTMKKPKILHRADSNSKSFKDMVLEIMHIHPKVDMNTPSPSPTDSISDYIELEVNEVIKEDKQIHVAKKTQQDLQLEIQNMKEEEISVNNINELFDDDDTILPKPSFPKKKEYENHPNVDKLILPDIPLNEHPQPKIEQVIVVQKVKRKKGQQTKL